MHDILSILHRAHELCESRGGRPGLPGPNKPAGFCVHEATLNQYLTHTSFNAYVNVGSSLMTQSDLGPTVLSREQRDYQKSDPGGDYYYVVCLGQTPVSLPE